jgi:hypothetical protein
MIVIKKTIVVLVSIVLLTSCSITKIMESKCILDKESNVIKGNVRNAKVFYDEMHFLPRVIENFLSEGKKPPIEYKDFSKKAGRINKFAGYHIYGCADTTWAKQKMAYHLMDKYHINRYDSTYFDTAYSVTVIDESKLEYSKDSCDYFMSLGSTFYDEIVTEYKCISWGMVTHFLMPIGMSNKTNSIESEDRPGYYNIKVPAYVYKEQGLPAYQKYLQDWLGLEMTFERVDTINIGVYEYRE